MPRTISDHGRGAGQATVEFALVLPLYAGLIACILATTAVCVAAVGLGETARNAARLASVSADPADTASRFVEGHVPAASAETRISWPVVTVTVRRRLRIAIPYLGPVGPGLGLTASATTVLEPPGTEYP